MASLLKCTPAGFLLLCLLSAAVTAQTIPPGGIGTVAGSVDYGFAGDQAAATSARIDNVYAIAIDVRGNLYIADSWNNRVRKVGRDGSITTIAGTGTEGFSGDAGPATAAQISCPRGVAADVDGNIYIADTGNSRVRKIAANGVISTVAGTGTPGYSGDGGPAAAAQLQYPRGLAVDEQGNLYIADSWNYRVRKVAKDGTIATVAGSGVEGFAGDGGKATDARLGVVTAVSIGKDLALLIADTSNHRVRRVRPDGAITTIAGTGAYGDSGDNGKAAEAQLRYPRGVASDPQGNTYIADAGNHRIRKIAGNGTITTVAGTGAAGSASDQATAASATLNTPYALAADVRGNVYVGDLRNYMVRKARFEPVTDRPAFAATSVVNSASGTSSVAGGSLITIFGRNFALEPATAKSTTLPHVLGGTIATVAGQEIPILYADATQIDAQLPAGTPVGSVPVKVAFGGVESDALSLNVSSSAPGVFTWQQNRAIVLNQDNRLNTPGLPAARGSSITIYATGQGPVSNTPPDGAPAQAAPASQTPVLPVVTLGGTNAPVVSSGLAPNLVGLWQIKAQVPANAPQGSAVELKVAMGGNTSPAALVSIR